MVRQKNRWLLVRFDFESDMLSSCSPGDATSATPKSSKKRKARASRGGNSNELTPSAQLIQRVTSTDIYRSLREAITQNFGLVGACAADPQVRLYDPEYRLAVIRTPRAQCLVVRSSLTLLTQIKLGGDALNVVASTIRVSGSARTARNAAREELKKWFYGQDLGWCGMGEGDSWSKKTRTAMEKGLQELENKLAKIDSAC